jgi:hypothetical protein
MRLFKTKKSRGDEDLRTALTGRGEARSSQLIRAVSEPFSDLHPLLLFS